MLVVLASRHDGTSRRLVEHWSGDARLLTCRDLSTRGWRYSPGRTGGTAVIGETVVEADEIDAVITRMPCVCENDLVGIVPDDRSYVAAEMTAYLSAWLSDLPCPVLNRPSPMSLMGPYWRTEQWIRTASRLGMPVISARRVVPSAPARQLDAPPPGVDTVTVIGRRALGSNDDALASAALALAQAAGVHLLRARFAEVQDEFAFLDADYWVDLGDAAVSDAISTELAGWGSR